MGNARFLVLTTLWLAAVGCASVYTAGSGDAPKDEGVFYYMPNQAIRIEVAIDKDGVASPKALAGGAYPDTARRFVMRSEDNFVGATIAKVGVNQRGLLTSATAESKSQLADALKNLATSVGSFSVDASPRRLPCATNATHSIDLPIEHLTFRGASTGGVAMALEPSGVGATALRDAQFAHAGSLCGYEILLVRLAGAKDEDETERWKTARAGLYYRQAMPYLVILARTIATREPGPPPKDVARQEMTTFLVHSPTGAPVRFAPLPRGFFAANRKASLKFEDGMLTEYDRNTDGELVSVFKLPADVLGAYTTAVGAAFQNRQTQASNETAERLRENERALTDLRIQLCRDAVASKDNARIEVACATKK